MDTKGHSRMREREREKEWERKERQVFVTHEGTTTWKQNLLLFLPFLLSFFRLVFLSFSFSEWERRKSDLTLFFPANEKERNTRSKERKEEGKQMTLRDKWSRTDSWVRREWKRWTRLSLFFSLSFNSLREEKRREKRKRNTMKVVWNRLLWNFGCLSATVIDVDLVTIWEKTDENDSLENETRTRKRKRKRERKLTRMTPWRTKQEQGREREREREDRFNFRRSCA